MGDRQWREEFSTTFIRVTSETDIIVYHEYETANVVLLMDILATYLHL